MVADGPAAHLDRVSENPEFLCLGDCLAARGAAEVVVQVIGAAIDGSLVAIKSSRDLGGGDAVGEHAEQVDLLRRQARQLAPARGSSGEFLENPQWESCLAIEGSADVIDQFLGGLVASHWCCAGREDGASAGRGEQVDQHDEPDGPGFCSGVLGEIGEWSVVGPSQSTAVGRAQPRSQSRGGSSGVVAAMPRSMSSWRSPERISGWPPKIASVSITDRLRTQRSKSTDLASTVRLGVMSVHRRRVTAPCR